MANTILAQEEQNYQNQLSSEQENPASPWIDVIDVDSTSSSNDIFNQTLDFVHRESAIAVLIHLGHQLTGFDKKLIQQVFNITPSDLDTALEESLFQDSPNTVAFL